MVPIASSGNLSSDPGIYWEGEGLWRRVIYKSGVYDITDFIHRHPGGGEKISLASGGYIEPFWQFYRLEGRPFPSAHLQPKRSFSVQTPVFANTKLSFALKTAFSGVWAAFFLRILWLDRNSSGR